KATADNDLGVAPLCVGGIKRFAHHTDAENLKELGRDAEPAQTLASIASGQINRPPLIAGDTVEGFSLGLPVEQVRRRSSSPQDPMRRILAKHHQAIRAGIRQRM